MMRSLWSAASGMKAQQTNVDTIANNLANVNTAGYKSEKVEFKSLLYQTLQTKTTTANGENKPIPAQVGLGTRVASITSNFTTGSFLASNNPMAFAIDGPGFFAVRGMDGENYYTKNGDLKLVLASDNTLTLANNDGYMVLDDNEEAITLPRTIEIPGTDEEGNEIVEEVEVTMSRIVVDQQGKFYFRGKDGELNDLDITIGLYQFNNPAGLDKLAGGLFGVTDASGPVLNEAVNQDVRRSSLKQGYLEGSNVQVADEMVNLIVAQRAYEMNSKAIQATDTMMEQANNLRR